MMASAHGATTRDQRLVEGVISQLPLFAGTAPGALHALARQCAALCVPRGQHVVRRGALLPGILVLASGSVKLSLRGGEGEERVMLVITGQQIFGEASALLGRGVPYDAVALTESDLVVIPPIAVFHLMERDARFARALVTLLAERKLELCAEIESATLHSGARRLASYLSELAGHDASPGACTVQLPFSKTLVAARLGVKKETLSRLLRQFSADGIIGVARRDIAILDRAKLSAVALH